MFDPADSEVFWLNMMNLALGLVTLSALVTFCVVVGRDVIARFRKPATARVLDDSHAFHLHDLGLTMADGGERTPAKKPGDSETPSEKH